MWAKALRGQVSGRAGEQAGGRQALSLAAAGSGGRSGGMPANSRPRGHRAAGRRCAAPRSHGAVLSATGRVSIARLTSHEIVALPSSSTSLNMAFALTLAKFLPQNLVASSMVTSPFLSPA